MFPKPTLIIIFLIVLFSSKSNSADVKCDILVAGGSTAALATAWTAAISDPTATVCLTEPSDWLGGQLTSSGVSAIDFGNANNPAIGNRSMNLSPLFRDLYKTFPLHSGACWVSTTCFLPKDLITNFINPRTSAIKNLRVFYNTCILNSTRNSSTGEITEVVAVQRTIKGGKNQWQYLLSEVLSDWYSPSESDIFTKEVLVFKGFKVVVDATEYGDILVTADGISVSQGIEIPTESGDGLIDNCGQANTITFYAHYNKNPPQNPWVPPPGCPPCTPPQSVLNSTRKNLGADCCEYHVTGEKVSDTWAQIWTYRRAVVNGNRSIYAVNPGDISQQNWDAQDSDLFIFLPLVDTKKQAQTGWRGGINISALQYSEQRSYGWFHFYQKNASENVGPYLFMNQTFSDTLTGLTRLPYLRDTRRPSSGIQGFRLLKSYLAGTPPPNSPPTAPDRGYKFPDTVAIGFYNVDIHTGYCAQKLPSYLENHTIYPYYIPYRALTVENSPNLLVAGKTMTQSFHANAATRLHPEEWSSGTAAGAACVLMNKNSWTSTQVYEKISVLQELLESIGQPMEWTL